MQTCNINKIGIWHLFSFILLLKMFKVQRKHNLSSFSSRIRKIFPGHDHRPCSGTKHKFLFLSQQRFPVRRECSGLQCLCDIVKEFSENSVTKTSPQIHERTICILSCLPSSSLVHLFSVFTLGSSLVDNHVLETHRTDQEKAEEAKQLLLALARWKTGLKLEILGNPLLAPRTTVWAGRSENLLIIPALKC